MQFSRASGTIIPVIGLILNILSLLALSKMKMNAQSLFLMKSLAWWDSIYLSSWIGMITPRYLAWLGGFEDLQYTVYQYVFRVVYCFFRISVSMAFWLVCLLTADR